MNEKAGAYVVEMRGVHTVLVGKTEGRNHLQDTGIDGRTILKWIFCKREWGMDWINLAQNRDRWWALVRAVMNFRDP